MDIKLIEIENDLECLKNELNRLKTDDINHYKKILSVYSSKEKILPPKEMIINEKKYYLYKKIIVDEIGTIKGRMDNEDVFWFTEDAIE